MRIRISRSSLFSLITLTAFIGQLLSPVALAATSSELQAQSLAALLNGVKTGETAAQALSLLVGTDQLHLIEREYKDAGLPFRTVTLPHARASGNKIFLDGIDDPIVIESVSPPVISFRNVKFSYDKRRSPSENVHNALQLTSNFSASGSSHQSVYNFLIPNANADLRATDGALKLALILLGFGLFAPPWLIGALIVSLVLVGAEIAFSKEAETKLSLPIPEPCPRKHGDDLTFSFADHQSKVTLRFDDMDRPVSFSESQGKDETVFFVQAKGNNWKITHVQKVGKSIQNYPGSADPSDANVLVLNSLKSMAEKCSNPNTAKDLLEKIQKANRDIRNSAATPGVGEGQPLTAPAI